jgi:predicted RNA methylase
VRICKIKLSAEARAVLARSRITADTVTLPEQIDRKLYEEIAKVFKAAGGKWNRGKACHLFAGDPREILGLAVESGEILDKKKTLQFFPTPVALAARMVVMAQIDEGDCILEPSAGTGSILQAIADYDEDAQCCPYVKAIEIDIDMAHALKNSDLASEVICADFMAMDLVQLGRWARIIANPPFHGGADITHIRRMVQALASGGRLVAICANGPKQEAELKPLATTWEELPAGTFPDTNVRTVLLTIDKE